MDKVYQQVADKLDLPKSTVAAVYKMYCSFIREKIREVKIGEETISLNLTRLGKFYLNSNKVSRKNEIKYKEDKANE